MPQKTKYIKNIFQIAIQSLFGWQYLHHFDSWLIFLSITLSIVLSIPWLIWYCHWKRNKAKTIKLIEYDIEFTLTPPHKRSIANDIDYEKAKVLKYQYCKDEIRENIARIIKIDPRQLEVTYIETNPYFHSLSHIKSKNKGACRIHIVHELQLENINRFDYTNMETLYENKYDHLSAIIKNIFHISLDWNVICTIIQSTIGRAPDRVHDSITEMSIAVPPDLEKVPSMSHDFNSDAHSMQNQQKQKPAVIQVGKHRINSIEHQMISLGPGRDDHHPLYKQANITPSNEDSLSAYMENDEEEKDVIDKMPTEEIAFPEVYSLDGVHRKVYSEGPKHLRQKLKNRNLMSPSQKAIAEGPDLDDDDIMAGLPPSFVSHASSLLYYHEDKKDSKATKGTTGGEELEAVVEEQEHDQSD